MTATPTRVDMHDGATAYVFGDPEEIRRRLENAHRRGWTWVVLPGDHRLDVDRIAAIDGREVQGGGRVESPRHTPRRLRPVNVPLPVREELVRGPRGGES